MQKNPLLESLKNFSFYLLFWFVVIILYFSLLYFQLNIRFETALTDGLVFNIILSGLGLSYWYTAKYISIENSNLRKIIFSHLVGGIIASGIWLTVGYYFIIFVLSYKDGFISFFSATLAWRFVIGALFYYLIISFYYLVISNSNLHEKISREEELKDLVTEAEIKSLKFQINPHFIFNSLNSMSALTTIAPERAREMILKLADFLRYTLANNNKKTNSLFEELKNIKLYLEIEKIRFEDKFDFVEDIQSRCMDVQIPTMILQPLFENAIKHAVYESLEKVTLKLYCRQSNEFLEITIENNYEPGAQNNKGAGIGLKNIKDRLELIYNNDNLLKVEKAGNIFKVRLFIPVYKKD